MADIIRLFGDGEDSFPSPSGAIQAAMEADLSMALVLGIERDGTVYVSTSTADAGLLVLLVEKFKSMVLS